MKFKKNDEVKIVMGKDKGKTGKIERVFPSEGKVLIAGINIVKRHMKGTPSGQKSGIKEIAKPLAVASVALVCPKCTSVTRAGFSIKEGKKIRICKKCEQEL